MRVLRDPAPSRLAYRAQRWMLTPAFRAFLRWGLPLGAVATAAGLWLADADNRAALAEMAIAARRAVAERPEFMVRLLAIEGASPRVAAHLRETLPVSLPASSFDLELEAIRARVERLEVVAAASVRVRRGGILEIAVTERQPAVVWRGRRELALLDPEGHRVAAIRHRSDRPGLPLLAGDDAARAVPEALALLEAAGPLASRIRGLLRVGARRWDVVLDRDQRILLPETGATAALERVIAWDEVRGLLSREVTLVDMRNPARPTVRMRETAAAEFRARMNTLLGAE